MRLRRLPINIIAFAGLALAGCAGDGTGTVKKTLNNPTYTDHSYSNILVVGVGGTYDHRAAFERAMVSRIMAEDATATAYYTVVGRNRPITRSTVSTAVKSRGFDAVLLTRVISQSSDVSAASGATETKVSRVEAGRVFDIFRYDYEELAEPREINVSSTVTLSAEMFSGPDETRMWAIEATIADRQNVGQIIGSAADTIMAQLMKDGLIGR